MASQRKPVVIITGASKGIGLATTKILLQEFNANVVALSRTKTPELLALRSASLLIIDCDVTDEAAVNVAISLTQKTYQHIDALILNAGVLDPMCRIGSDTPLESWKTHFDVNFFSLVTALKAALPDLRKSELGGRVVFISSGAAVKGTAGWGPYNAAKAAMNSLCRTLAEEEPGVIAIALRPGMVDTDMQAQLRMSGAASMSKESHDSFVRAYAEGKLIKPEDSGHVIAALSLKAPAKMSGQFVGWDSDDCRDFRRGK